jgi:large subunit ribosomal protein L33
VGERLKVVLVCEVCGARNYQTTKARIGNTERLALKKFCSACNKHTLHKESK